MSSERQQDSSERRRSSARRAALGVLVRAFPGRTTILALLALLSGAPAAGFALLVGRLVGQLPDVVTGGFDSAEGRRVVTTLVLIGTVLVVQEAVNLLRLLATTDLQKRMDEYLLARVMTTTMAVPGLELFEDPELAAATNRAASVARYGPGELISGLSYRWTSLSRGLAATILVATIWPVAAGCLLILWLVVSRHLQADFYRANPFWTDPLRRAVYLNRLTYLPDWAKELRIFGLTGWIVDKFSTEWQQVMAELWRTRRVGYRTTTLLTVVILAANVVVMVLAARAALRGDLELATLTVLVQGLFAMAMLASQDGDIWIENGAIPVPDVLAHERAAAAITSAPDPTARSATGLPARAISFEGVRFGYPSRDRPVYDGLDLTIEAGRSLAVVGLNGAGKTTLIKLLTGLLHPQDGRITVDGIDLADLDSTSWRRSVAAIFQDFVHYQLPARDNVGFGAVEGLHVPDVDARVLAAAGRAGADTIIERLPTGLDTVLSRRHDGGVDLSGGQWQRIALARAMAAVSAGARVLVLDEPTAHLDVRAEADLYDRFLDLTHGLTSIVISHRFSTVRRADRIVVLDGGRITEDGTHDELVAAGGRYSGLFRTQAMRYHAEDRDTAVEAGVRDA
ncbi:ABC transporter ATP-binding protein [Actinopolymorpha sp. B17G11]|uniref:ABC transporter ATP-binding protein n=1 Tax=Actinopolymorpha sp. B17G11 TaxID=3160861 RepID=UPI0032E45890